MPGPRWLRGSSARPRDTPGGRGSAEGMFGWPEPLASSQPSDLSESGPVVSEARDRPSLPFSHDKVGTPSLDPDCEDSGLGFTVYQLLTAPDQVTDPHWSSASLRGGKCKNTNFRGLSCERCEIRHLNSWGHKDCSVRVRGCLAEFNKLGIRTHPTTGISFFFFFFFNRYFFPLSARPCPGS